MDGAGELDLLRRKVSVRIIGELLAQNQDAVKGRAQLVRHVGEELGLVFRSERKLGCLLLQGAARLLDFLILPLHLDVSLCQLLRLLLELLVGLLQLPLLRLQFARELLRLLEQSLGLHRRLDAVDHDADVGGQLLQEHHLQRGELAQRCELDHRLDLAFEQHREHHGIARRRLEQRRADRNDALGHLAYQNAALIGRTLANQPFAERNPLRMAGDPVVGIRGKQLQTRNVVAGDLINDAELGIDQRRELGEQQSADGGEIALPLQHVGELGEVRFQPVLLGIAVSREPQVVDHRIDVVF